jgi:3-hydroxyacyl-[acyl-carrier-protein] dehydratase
MGAEEIERRIPHRAPMLLIDQIVSRDDSSIICLKTFHADEFFVQGHFPGQPIVPGVIHCECCMQAGALLIASDPVEGALPVATRMDSVKFKRMVRPGDTVEIQVTLNDRVSNAFYLTGKVMLDGKLAARLDFACSLSEPQNIESA